VAWTSKSDYSELKNQKGSAAMPGLFIGYGHMQIIQCPAPRSSSLSTSVNSPQHPGIGEGRPHSVRGAPIIDAPIMWRSMQTAGPIRSGYLTWSRCPSAAAGAAAMSGRRSNRRPSMATGGSIHLSNIKSVEPKSS
jgi:hypothetical protein